MTKLYVIVKNNFEYNDEIYAPHDGGQPIKAFKTRAKAEAEAMKKNIKHILGLDSNYGGLYAYGYDEDEIIKPGTLDKLGRGKPKPTEDKPLAGKSFCVTGKLSRTRDEVHKLIETAGGEVHDSVRKGTTYLIAGDKVGAVKLQKAEYLGTTVITEDDFIGMLDDEFGTSEAPSSLEDMDFSSLTREQQEILVNGLINPFYEVYEITGE